MKIKSRTFLVTIALFMGAFVVSAQPAQKPEAPKPAVSPAPTSGKMSELDQEKLKRIGFQIGMIQDKLNALAKDLHAQEVVAEQESVISKVCGDHHIAKVDCDWNAETGEVKPKPKPTPIPEQKK